MVSLKMFVQFLVIVVFISAVNSDKFKKCCANNEGLNRNRLNSTTEVFICSKFEQNVLPLMLKNENNVQFGMPQKCGSESCIDKTIDGKNIIEILCDNKQTKLTTKINSFNKCCPLNSTYNKLEKRCMFTTNTFDHKLYNFGTEVYNLLIKNQTICEETNLEEFYIQSHNITKVFGGKSNYCFEPKNDKNNIVVYSCKNNKKSNLKFTKCCEFDEALTLNQSSKSYYCSSEFGEDILPLKSHFSEKINFGIPELCQADRCIDKEIENQTVIELFCDKNVTRPSIDIPTIYKCCPPNMIYNIFSKSCIINNSTDESLIYDLSALMYDIKFSYPKCDNITIVDYSYEGEYEINYGVLTLNHSKKFEKGSYCIDKNRKDLKIYVRACEHIRDVCSEKTCIPKCCPSGQRLVKKSRKAKTTCEADIEMPFIFNITSSGETLEMSEDVALLHVDLQCKKYLEKNFQIYKNGSVFTAKNIFHPLTQKLCVEHVQALDAYVALICFPKQQPNLQNFYYLAGLIVSIIFLAITLTTYFFLPELQNLHGKTVMSHTISLLVSYIFLAFVKTPTTKYDKSVCLILGYGIMYAFLTAFAWLNVMCFDIWYTFGVVKARGLKKNKDIKKFLMYSFYAYTMPLLLTGIAIYMDLGTNAPDKYKPNFARDACWFDLRNGKEHLPYTIYFGTPVAIILLFNFVLFALTVRHCLKVRGDIQRMQHADSPKKRRFFTDKATLVMNFKLFIVMGISWSFEVGSMYVRNPIWLWFILDSINVLQGLWIFFIFVLKDNVWKALRKKLGYRVLREGSQTQSTGLTTKNSVTHMTHVKLNGITKPDEKNLLQNALKNSLGSTRI